MATTANLCKCNNCNSILIDQNPQVGAKEFYLKGTELEMQYNPGLRMEDEDDEEDDNLNDRFWVCPVCMTDANLDDDMDGEDYKEVVTIYKSKS